MTKFCSILAGLFHPAQSCKSCQNTVRKAVGRGVCPQTRCLSPTDEVPVPRRNKSDYTPGLEQAKNASALSALSSDLEGRLSDNQIIVEYNYGSLDAHPELKPTIKISPSATIVEDIFTQTEENGETI